MGAIIAGLRGGVTADQSAVSLGEFSLRLLSGQSDNEDIWLFLKHGGLPRFLSVVVNDTCNLRCRHCYLQPDKSSKPALTEAEWSRVVDSLCESDVRMVCLSGKEVFVGNMGPTVLSMLQRARSEHRGFFRLGAITNGTLLHRHKSALLEGDMCYLDVSMDGMRAAHDRVRGQGSWDQTAANVRWLAPAFGNRLFGMVTLLAENMHQAPEIVAGMSQLGFHGMGFGFYLPQSYTDPALCLKSSDAGRIFESLHGLRNIQVERPISVLVELDTQLLDQMLAFFRSEWFEPATLKVDRMGELFNEHAFENGVTLQFRVTPYPTGIWKASRLNPDGNYLAAEDTVDAKSYQRRAIANIRDFDFDLEATNRAAMVSPRVAEIFADYCSSILPRIVAAAKPRLDSACAATSVFSKHRLPA